MYFVIGYGLTVCFLDRNAVIAIVREFDSLEQGITVGLDLRLQQDFKGKTWAIKPVGSVMLESILQQDLKDQNIYTLWRFHNDSR